MGIRKRANINDIITEAEVKQGFKKEAATKDPDNKNYSLFNNEAEVKAKNESKKEMPVREEPKFDYAKATAETNRELDAMGFDDEEDKMRGYGYRSASAFDNLSNKIEKEYEAKGKSKEEAEKIGDETAAAIGRRKGKIKGADAKLTLSSIKSANTDPYIYNTQDLSDEDLLKALRLDVISENDAVNNYSSHAEGTSNPEAKETLNDIADEEKVHIGELEELLAKLSDDDVKMQEGMDEQKDITKQAAKKPNIRFKIGDAVEYKGQLAMFSDYQRGGRNQATIALVSDPGDLSDLNFYDFPIVNTSDLTYLGDKSYFDKYEIKKQAGADNFIDEESILDNDNDDDLRLSVDNLDKRVTRIERQLFPHTADEFNKLATFMTYLKDNNQIKHAKRVYKVMQSYVKNAQIYEPGNSKGDGNPTGSEQGTYNSDTINGNYDYQARTNITTEDEFHPSKEYIRDLSLRYDNNGHLTAEDKMMLNHIHNCPQCRRTFVQASPKLMELRRRGE